MKKITIPILLALVAFVSAGVPAKEVDITGVIDLLGKIGKVDPKTIEKLLNVKSLANLDKKDPEIAQLARLLERISKVDWEAAYLYSVENKFTFDHQLNIDGKKVNIKNIFDLLGRIGATNWTDFSSLYANVKSINMADRSKGGGLDMVKVKERADKLEGLVRLRHRLKYEAASKRPQRKWSFDHN